VAEAGVKLTIPKIRAGPQLTIIKDKLWHHNIQPV